MTYARFEEQPVWKRAVELAHASYDFAERVDFGRAGDLRSQFLRAALSVSNNIAEGFEIGTKEGLLKFLYIAKGSAGEVRSMLHFMEGRPGFGHFKSQISDLKSKCEDCSKQLAGWCAHLQNSEIKGVRHLNDKTRAAALQEAERKRVLREREEFLVQLREEFPIPGM